MSNTSSEVTQEMIDKRLNVGLQNMWHPVLPSWGVNSDPVGITRLSENIALLGLRGTGFRPIDTNTYRLG